MCLWEHILDLFTGPDVPLRNLVFPHRSFPFITQSLSLTDTLHNGKCKTALHSHADKVDHNIISRTDCCRNRCLTFFDQCLCVAEPHVRTMGQTCYSDKIREILRLCINKHLHGKIRTEFRNSKTSQFTSSDILWLDPQCIRTGKK